MTQFESTMSPPPQQPGEIPAQPSTWPTVLGIISIVLASLGILTNLCGGVAAVFMPAIMGAIGDAAPKDDPMIKVQVELAHRFMAFNLANAVIVIGLGVILLSAGIGLARRRRTAVGKVKLWAIGRIIWSIPAAYATYVITDESLKMMQQAAADSGKPMPGGGFATFMAAMGPISAAINFAIWCAVPIFMLIWFSRGKIKSETSRW